MATLGSPLDDALGSRAKVRLLRLFITTAEPVSGREAGRRIGMAKRAADLALRDLTAMGLVSREKASSQMLYRANVRHVLVRFALQPLFAGEVQATGKMFAALRSAIGAAGNRLGKSPAWAGLYGSVARGDETPESDIDLAVIVQSRAEVLHAQDTLSELAPRFTEDFGRKLSPLVMTVMQLRRLAAAKDPLVDGLIRDGRQIAGSEPDIRKVIDG